MSGGTGSVLVIGATGNQGGAVADHLLSGTTSGYRPDVVALTRNPDRPEAHRLDARGAEVLQGNLADVEATRTVMEQVDGVFCVVNFWVHGYDRQVDLALRAAEAAEAAEVDHLVFSSILNAERADQVPHFQACREIEERLEAAGIPLTVVRPGFFYRNFEALRDEILDGRLAQPLEEGDVLEMVDIHDLGRVVARILADPGEHEGRRIEVAGSQMELAEIAETFTEVLGDTVRPERIAPDEAKASLGEKYAEMLLGFGAAEAGVDIDALEDTFGPFRSLADYLRANGWDRGETRPTAQPGWTKPG